MNGDNDVKRKINEIIDYLRTLHGALSDESVMRIEDLYNLTAESQRHVTSAGTDHQYIDQNVTRSGRPHFNDIRVRGPWKDVRALNVVGDDSTDNTAAIQNIIDNLGTEETMLLFPPGIYRISSSINVNDKIGLQIAGYGRRSVIKNTGSDYCFKFTDCESCLIQDIVIQ